MTVAGSPPIAVVDYGIGNLRSAEKALQHVGADARLTADSELIADAAAVVVPGVGAFGACMAALHESELTEVVLEAAASGRPFLGICVGMQMLYDGSDEDPDTPGVGVLSGSIHLLPETVKRPQMQWNRIEVCRPIELLAGLDGAWMYFVHSYSPEITDETVAVCDYGGPVVAVAGHDRLWATQFHPEKSGRAGLRLLENFVRGI